MTPAVETLFLPLENELIAAQGPVLFLGASCHPYLKTLPSLEAWQPFRPLAAELEKQGVQFLKTMPAAETYGTVLIHLPKQGEEARYWIALALYALKKDGLVLMAASNDAGGGRLLGWAKEAGLVPESLSKNRARVVWSFKNNNLSPILEAWLEEGRPQYLLSDSGQAFLSQPGLFGWDKIDEGSHLLAEHLPVLKGRGADFGCGYGYLSRLILEKNADIQTLYAIDADCRAIDRARENISILNHRAEFVFLWEDLSKFVPSLPPIDFIVMNPPFHIGKKTDNALGRSFIKTAAHHLKKGGVLWMVANVHLPYESELADQFQTVRTVLQKDGFKIFHAVK